MRFLVETPSKHLLHSLAHLPVELRPTAAQDRVVGRLSRQFVPEHELHVRHSGRFADQVHALQRTEVAIERNALVRHALEHLIVERTNDHRRDLQRSTCFWIKLIDSRDEQCLQIVRDRDLLDRRRRPPMLTRLITLNDPTVDQRTHHFLDEERVALGLLQDQLPSLVREIRDRQQVVDQRLRVLTLQRL